MEISNSHSAPASRRSIWLERGLVLTLLLGCALVMADNSPPAALWHHVFTGVDLWSNGLAEAANPDYGSQLVLAQLAIRGESTALLVFKCLLGTAVLALMISRSYRRAISLAATALVVLPVAITLAPFWQVAPAILGCVLFFALCWLLDRAFEDWTDCGSVHWRYLWCLPVVFALWANLHASYLPALAFAAVALVSRSGEALLRWRRHAARSVGSFAALLVLTATATLLNPYGWLMPQAAARMVWQELAAPSTFAGSLAPTLWAFAALLLLGVVAYTRTQRRCDATQWLLLTLTAAGALLLPELIACFALAAGLWLPAHVDSALTRIWGKRTTTADHDHPQGQWLPAGVVGARRRLPLPAKCAAAVVIVLVTGMLGASLVVRLSMMPVAKTDYPLDAMQFVVARGVENRLAINTRWTPYAAAVLGPARVTPLAADSDGSAQGVAVIVLEDGRDAAHRQRLDADDAWVLLYDDNVTSVYGRGEVYRDRDHRRYLPVRTMAGLLPMPAVVDWPALPLIVEPTLAAELSNPSQQP